jgi:methyl-galactoside transport system substrate-binding protein
MKYKKTVSAVVIIGMFLLFLQVGKNTQASEPEGIHVGIACYDKSDTFISELVASFQEQLKEDMEIENEIIVTVEDAAGSQRTQNEEVKELISGGCDVLCVNLVDRTDPSEIIDLAMENDVPVIFFNREPVEEDMSQWDRLYYVGADARQSGEMQGELAADIINKDDSIDRNKDGKIQYVILEGEPGHQDAIIRTESVVDTLQHAGIALDRLGSGIANWNRAQAQNRMTQLINQYQTQIELVLANNDDMALGAYEAYEKLNYTESARPVFIGIDGTDEGLRGVESGVLAGTIYNDKEGQAEAMAKLVNALVTGSEIDSKSIYLPYETVTLNNVSSIFENVPK